LSNRRHLLIVVGLFLVALPLSAQAHFLGVLEDVPGVYSGESNHRAVRVVFKKDAGGWSPMPSHCGNEKCLTSVSSLYPHEVKWIVTFDGKRIGEVTGQAQEKFEFYSHIGLQKITADGTVPTIGKRSVEFSGFLETPVYRPLVVNSQPYSSDPEKWKPVTPDRDLMKQLRLEFRRKFPNVTNCINPDEDAAKPWAYQDSNIKISKAYSSASGWLIGAVLLDEYKCDGIPDSPFIDQWFAISPQRTAQFLDEGMWLVDAGDYDNDGKSELLFSINRYNRGGYEIFYDGFTKQAKFEFSYH
jgi:hypothetical protein